MKTTQMRGFFSKRKSIYKSIITAANQAPKTNTNI